MTLVRQILNSALDRLLVSAVARRDLAPRDGLSSWVLAEPRPGLRIWVDLGDYGVSRPCMGNAFEPVETAFVESYLRPGMWFVDVGANIGWFSLLAAKRIGPKGRVVAFEPRPDSSKRLSMSAVENGIACIQVYRVAVGARPGRMKVGALLSGHNTGGTWLLTTKELLERTAVGHQLFDVDVIRLDDSPIDRCDLLKLDVEGAEYLVLQGAKETIARHRPIILSEINAEPLRLVSKATVSEYVGLMGQLGYQPHELTSSGPGRRMSAEELNRITVAFNVLFLHRETARGGRLGVTDAMADPVASSPK